MMPTTSPRSAADPPRVIAVSYGELDDVHAVSGRTGLSEGRLRSMRAHPYARPGDLAVLAQLVGSRPVSTLSVIPGRLRIDGDIHRIDWASGWTARPEASGGGAALLLRAARTAPSFGGHLLSPDALRVYRAARADLVRIPRLILLRRSRPYVERILPSRLAFVLGVPIDVILRAMTAAVTSISGSPPRGYVLDEVDRFDERLDAVDAADDRPVFVRDNRELNWAMTAPWDPDARHRYRSFYLRRAGSSEVVGYAWVRLRTYGRARVASLFRTGLAGGSDRRIATAALLDGVLDALGGEQLDLIDTAGNDALLIRAARSRGFLQFGHIDAGYLLAREVRQALAKAQEGATFRINMAEGDVIFL